MDKRGILIGIILIAVFGIIANINYVLADNSNSSGQKNNGAISSDNSDNNENVGENELGKEYGNITRERNRLRTQANGSECPVNCTCSGSATKCRLQNGTREMTITAGKSGNIIFQVKEVNASTNVTLYHHDGKVYATFENNKTKRIMTPEQVQERIKEKEKAKLEEHNMSLDEDGYYRVQSKKKARLFYLFPVREQIRTQIDAETGEIIKIRNPWWGFLANDVDDETLLGESCGTVTPGQNDECCQNKGYDYWNSANEQCEFNTAD